MIAGFNTLTERFPEKFDMILSPDNPHYKDLPGLAVLLGGMWMMNVSYWGFNQYIIQRGLAAKSVNEAQKGIVLAAFLKLIMPAIIVVPGIAALVLVPGLERTDQAYPSLMAMLPVGIKGLVFAALVAAIVASTGSKINSIATIFTMDLYRAARPQTTADAGQGGSYRRDRFHPHRHLHHQAVPQQFPAGLPVHPGLHGIRDARHLRDLPAGPVLGAHHRHCRNDRSVGHRADVRGFRIWLPEYPFMNRVGWCFVVGMVIAVVISLASPKRETALRVDIKNVDFTTGTFFNVAALIIVAILAWLYVTWW